MRDQVDKVVRGLLVFLMGFMLVNVVWQVFSRYILGSPSTFTSEMARYLLIWVSLLGGAYASGKNLHLAITLLPDRLSESGRQKLSILIYLLIIAFVLIVMVIGGGRLVYISYSLGQTSSALQIPLAYVYLILPLSGMLITYYKILDVRDALHAGTEPQNVES